MTVKLDGGDVLRTRSIVLAMGVEWRRLEIDSIDRFVGSGIYYGAARSDASVAQGNDVYLIGAGNSAGQAAIFFSNHARSVTLLVRGESLAESMSTYLIEQIATKANIRVETRSEVVAVHGANNSRRSRSSIEGRARHLDGMREWSSSSSAPKRRRTGCPRRSRATSMDSC